MTNNEKRGKFITELRREKGLTQQQLGELTHYTDKAVSRWERGDATLNPDVISNLSTIFGVSISELVYGEREVEENKQEIQKNLEKEYKKDYHKYRKVKNRIIVTFMFLIILVLVAVYFIFIRNSLTVYSLIGDSEKVKEENAILIISNKLSILNFNKLIIKDDVIVDSIRLYYVDSSNNEKEIFAGGNDNYYIEEKNGYSEYNLRGIPKGKLYIEVKYSNKETETLKLEMQRKFINDNIFPKKAKNISEETNNIDGSDDKLKERLLSLGFENIDDELMYKINEEANCYINLDANRLKVIIFKDDIKEELISYIGIDNFEYTRLENGKWKNENYENKNEKKDCMKEECSSIDEYANFINYIKEKLQ